MLISCDCGSEYPKSLASPIRCPCGKRLEFESEGGNLKPATVVGEPAFHPTRLLGLDTPTARTSRAMEIYKNRVLSKHWDSLHAYPIREAWRWNSEEASDFYKDWKRNIPSSGGCNCESEWPDVEREIPPNFSSSIDNFKWSVRAHNRVNLKLGKPLVSETDAYARYRYSTRRYPIMDFVTWDEFTNDTSRLMQMILERHPRVGGIAGCPRSGLRAAADIAIRLSLPLYFATEEDGLQLLKGGERTKGGNLHGELRAGGDEIILVEDSACSGHSINALRRHPDLSTMPLYAVYGAYPARDVLDGFAVFMDLPHWFEWNFWNNGQIMKDFNVGLDWDGVLNDDCPPDFDDDGERYADWLNSVKPIRLCRGYTVPFIVTARLEKYRSICEQWLRRFGINYRQLIMYQGTFEQRMVTDIGKWKAEKCIENNIRLYVESDMHISASFSVNAPAIQLICTTKGREDEGDWLRMLSGGVLH